MSSQSEVEPGLARRRPTRATSPSPSHGPDMVAAPNLSDVRASIGQLWASLGTPRGQWLLAWTLVIAAIVLDCVLVGQHALVRYQSYRADAFDLGNMDQAVWNTLHGHPFRFTNRGLDTVGPPTRLAIHVEPILFLIAPLYLLHAGPETLIVLQTVALALGALPLFLLGLRRLPALPLVAAAIAVAYLVTPELLGEALWDFHPVALATPLLLLALWALDARRWLVFFVAAALAALTKEDVALSLLPLGLYIAFWLGRRRLGLGLLVGSVAWLALCFLVILPHYNTGVAGGNNYWYRYAWLGATPHEAVINLLTHPWLPITYVFGDTGRSGYIALLLRTGAGLSIFAPALWICGLPELAVNALSVHWEQYSGFYQYNAMLVAYLMVASVYGVAALYNARLHAEHNAHSGLSMRETDGRTPGWGAHRLRLMRRRIAVAYHRALERIPVPSRWIAPLVVIWLVVSGFWNITTPGIGPRLNGFWRAGSGPIPHQAQIDALLARVPRAASVAATDTLNPHLSDRYTLYLMPDPQSYQAEYVAVNLDDVPPYAKEADQRMYDTMLASGRYAIVGRVGTVVVLRRVGLPLKPAGGP